MTRLSWVAHSLIGLCKPLHHNKAMINEEAVEYYSAIKMDGLYIHSKTLMDLKYVVREKVIFKRSQTIWFYCVLFSKGQNYRDGEQTSGCQGYTGRQDHECNYTG